MFFFIFSKNLHYYDGSEIRRRRGSGHSIMTDNLEVEFKYFLSYCLHMRDIRRVSFSNFERHRSVPLLFQSAFSQSSAGGDRGSLQKISAKYEVQHYFSFVPIIVLPVKSCDNHTTALLNIFFALRNLFFCHPYLYCFNVKDKKWNLTHLLIKYKTLLAL